MSFSVNVPVVDAVAGAYTRTLDLVSEFVEDPDKRAQLSFELAKLQQASLSTIVQTQTIPWVDAMVKVMYASVALARPLGSFLITGFGLYAHWKGLGIPEGIHGGLDSSFGLWMGSRHMNKTKEEVEKTRRAELGVMKPSGYDVLQ